MILGQPHGADQIGDVPGERLDAYSDVLPGGEQGGGRLRAEGCGHLLQELFQRGFGGAQARPQHGGVHRQLRRRQAEVLLDTDHPGDPFPSLELLIHQSREVVGDLVQPLVEGVVDLADHRDAAFGGDAGQGLDPQVRGEGAVIERVTLVAGGGVEDQAEVLRIHLAGDHLGLPLRQLPRLPPQPRPRVRPDEYLLQVIEKARQPLVEGDAAAARTRPIVAADPRPLVEGVDHDVVHLGKAGGEVGQQAGVLVADLRIQNTGGLDRRLIEPPGDAEVGDGAKTEFFRLGDAMPP